MALYNVLCILALMAATSSWLTIPVNAKFYKNLGVYKPGVQHMCVFEFYMHDYAATNISTTFASLPNETFNGMNNTNLFGAIVVADDSLTVAPDSGSMEVGRGQGFYVFDSMDPSTGKIIEFIFTVVFNEASGFGGSTLAVKGADHFNAPSRELAIVGGTGMFRMARGWADFSTEVFIPGGGGEAILAFKAYVFYGV